MDFWRRESWRWQEEGKWWKSRQEKAQRERAATALRQIKRHSMYKGKGRTDSSKCKSYSGSDECLSFLKMPNAEVSSYRMEEKTVAVSIWWFVCRTERNLIQRVHFIVIRSHHFAINCNSYFKGCNLASRDYLPQFVESFGAQEKFESAQFSVRMRGFFCLFFFWWENSHPFLLF